MPSLMHKIVPKSNSWLTLFAEIINMLSNLFKIRNYLKSQVYLVRSVDIQRQGCKCYGAVFLNDNELNLFRSPNESIWRLKCLSIFQWRFLPSQIPYPQTTMILDLSRKSHPTVDHQRMKEYFVNAILNIAQNYSSKLNCYKLWIVDLIQ